jgi:hypothetical protein
VRRRFSWALAVREIVEHERGYRSQFAKIISLDYGDPNLLENFRLIYRVNPAPTSFWTDFIKGAYS